MNRIAVAYVLRWLFISFWLALYWWGVGTAIAEGRSGPHMEHTEWLGAAFLTLPWSLADFAVDPHGGNERLWLTAITVSGAMLNTLIFVLTIRWITGGPRRPPDPQVPDYLERR